MVFGNIAMAPLYTVNQIFFGREGLLPSPQNVYGCIGLIVWAVTIVVTVQYFLIVLRATRGGEGGPLVLRSFITRAKIKSKRLELIAGGLLILAVGFFIGDGMAIPAMGITSALEGVRSLAPGFSSSALLFSFLILTGFYLLQQGGAGKAGRIMGIFVFLWLAAIGYIGLLSVLHNTEILNSLNPVYILIFVSQVPLHQIVFVLSSVVLSVAGAEILYARLGSTKKKYVYVMWLLFVYPMILLSYLGQGAYLLSGRLIMHDNVFYSMVPEWALASMTALALSVVFAASQAWISAVFSLISQAIAQQIFPRIRVVFAGIAPGSDVNVPGLSWFLYLGSAGFLLVFQTSLVLATVYGLSTSGLMLITLCSIFIVAAGYWRWGFFRVLLILVPFFCIDICLFCASLLKLPDGGYMPVEIALILYTVMKVWEWGRGHMKYAIQSYHSITMKELIHRKISNESFLPRSVIVMTPKPVTSVDDAIPAIEQLFIDKDGLLPKNILFLTVNQHAKPYMFNARYQIVPFYKDHAKGQIVSVNMNFGSQEEPDVKRYLVGLARHRLLAISEHPDTWLIHVLEEHVVRSKSLSVVKTIAFKLYDVLEKNSIPLGEYFGLGNVSGLSSEFLPVKIHTS